MNGIRLVRAHMEDFLNTDSQVIFGRIVKHCKAMRTTQIKQKLIENVLKMNGINGEMLCKKVRSDTAILPHHMRFSDLLQCATNKNNPLLSNKIQNGYEIDISCALKDNREPHLIASISELFDSLDLDIRTIDVSIADKKLATVFFVQEKKEFAAAAVVRRNAIELGIAQIFQSRNIAATIKTKAIQMGKEAHLSDNNVINCHNSASFAAFDNQENQQPKQIQTPEARRLTGSISEIVFSEENANRINISVDIPDDIQIDLTELALQRNLSVNSSPTSSNATTLKSCVGITESTVIITPKHASELPPSIEKTGTTFNLIGFKKIDEEIEEILHDSTNSTKPPTLSTTTSKESSRSVSVIDILNNASTPNGFVD